MAQVTKQGDSNGRSIINVEVCLLDPFSVIALRIRETKQSFLQEITANASVYCKRAILPISALTLLRSKKQMQCFANHAYLRHQQYHPHPIWKLSILHGHAENLGSYQLNQTLSIGLLTTPSIAIGTVILANYSFKYQNMSFKVMGTINILPVAHCLSAMYGPHFFQYLARSRSSLRRFSSSDKYSWWSLRTITAEGYTNWQDRACRQVASSIDNTSSRKWVRCNGYLCRVGDRRLATRELGDRGGWKVPGWD